MATHFRRNDVERSLVASAALCAFLGLVPRLGRRDSSPATACRAHLQRIDGDAEHISARGFDCRRCRAQARAPSLDEWSPFWIHGRHNGCSSYRRAREMGEGVP
jgi:hypothetical protein